MAKKTLLPFVLPVAAFSTAITVGTVLLYNFSSTGTMSWIDALFTATSAVCVTGLTVLDPASSLTHGGQLTLLTLIQLGGLGIMTYSSLALFLLRRRVTLTDRLAVGQALLHNSSFDLGRFLLRLAGMTFIIEIVGASLLFYFGNGQFTVFSAFFHSISAFCNAGFSLFPDSLMGMATNLGVNVTIMMLIILGGLGFAVLDELTLWFRNGRNQKFSFVTKIILSTTTALIIIGTVVLFISRISSPNTDSLTTNLITSLFQSVTARTAGFNTVNMAEMTNLYLLFMIFLMIIGGAPGSCAGGIKVTTFRALGAFMMAQVRGREQVVIGNKALDSKTINKVVTLVFVATLIIGFATVALNLTEGGNYSHTQLRGQFLEIFFEVVSAFGTVGLSLGLTAKLTTAGKCIVIALMFVGRIGPIWLLTTLQQFHSHIRYKVPETDLPIG
ncbi:TrkH family potassium uptake protein [Halodesulfovibrio marinisediminis]|uniref:Trk system potassium uptake protein TrkH n=1 Tax=Halodesulfovibrio marinisediminis DSM 17456 TaxID=1121457 RepID=A0A1N6IDK0_9BACT|nr:potassium transporter TrkG [Halodesulfovibrio marinisediminis]SIO30051.1 trk system potassium uptake protein TrkH [Halodesulfovibrio marinisediminis DSM 17456]